MDNFESNIIELRIHGNGISPASVSASEVATLISNFEKLILDNARARYPLADPKQLPTLHFSEVRDESISIRLKEDITKVASQFKYSIKESFLSLGIFIGTGQIDHIASKPLGHLNSIQSILKKYDAEAELKWNGDNVANFNRYVNFEVAKSIPGEYSGKTTIIGRLDDVGGITPNIHIHIDGKDLVIWTSREIAKKLAPSLYEVIVLDGIATWNTETDEIIKFTIDEVIEYKVGGTYEAILELRELSSGYWDNFNSDEEINEALLRD